MIVDDICAVKASEPAAWRRIHNSELYEEICRPSGSLPSNDASNDRGFQNTNPHTSNLDLDSKPALQKSCKIAKYNSGYSKKSGVVQMENCKSKPGHDADGVSPELASSSAICNVSGTICLRVSMDIINIWFYEKKSFLFQLHILT